LVGLQAQHWKNLEEWCEEGGDTHIESCDVEWTSDDPDPVAISRLKKSGNSQGILEERVPLSTPGWSSSKGVCNNGFRGVSFGQKSARRRL
jgi:hypothetical protein